LATIELENVSKGFRGGTPVLDDITLTIEDGEFFILVGPSGCGKSTLLNAIVGLEQLSAGEIRVDGQRVDHLDPKDRDMAMVFQSYALYPHMTVRENIAFPLRLAGLRKAEIASRVAAAAEMLELAAILDRKPARLSGGQRQRVAMGRALVRKPKAFLLDEPLSNLDARLRVQTRSELARLQQRLGATMIYVTHDQTEAMTLGHRVAILNGGRIQQVGAPRELYRNPSNLFVAGFLGSPGMNLIPARIDGAGLVLPIGTIDWKSLPPGFAGRKQAVLVGIRPEHFHRARTDESPPHALRVEARAEWVEWLGAETFVQLGPQVFDLPAGSGGVGELAAGQSSAVTSAAPIVARLDGTEQVAVGSPVRLWVDAEDMYLFDANSGITLSPSPSQRT